MGSLLEHKNHYKVNVYLYLFYFYPEVTTFPVVSKGGGKKSRLAYELITLVVGQL